MQEESKTLIGSSISNTTETGDNGSSGPPGSERNLALNNTEKIPLTLGLEKENAMNRARWRVGIGKIAI